MTMTEGNSRFGNRLADGITIGCSSLSAVVSADEYKSAFVVTFIFCFSIGFNSGLEVIKYQPIAKLCPFYVTLLETLHNSSFSHNMHQDSRPFAKLKELQSRHTIGAHLILPDRTKAHPPPRY